MSRFDYVKYDGTASCFQQNAKEKFGELEGLIEMIKNNSVPRNSQVVTARSAAMALTKLEECYMWVGKAIRDEQMARNGSSPLQEDRTNS